MALVIAAGNTVFVSPFIDVVGIIISVFTLFSEVIGPVTLEEPFTLAIARVVLLLLQTCLWFLGLLFLLPVDNLS